MLERFLKPDGRISKVLLFILDFSAKFPLLYFFPDSMATAEKNHHLCEMLFILFIIHMAFLIRVLKHIKNVL